MVRSNVKFEFRERSPPQYQTPNFRLGHISQFLTFLYLFRSNSTLGLCCYQYYRRTQSPTPAFTARGKTAWYIAVNVKMNFDIEHCDLHINMRPSNFIYFNHPGWFLNMEYIHAVVIYCNKHTLTVVIAATLTLRSRSWIRNITNTIQGSNMHHHTQF